MELGTLITAWVVIAPIMAILGAALAHGWRARVAWFCFGLLLPPSVAWLAVRRARGHPEGPDVEKPRPFPEPVGAADDDLAFVPEPAKACPDCGYLGIRSPDVRDGVWPGGGELVLYVCPRCHYRGVPIEFDRREDYADFLRKLNVAARAS